MMGGPGSGKSYIRKQRFADLEVLDADSIKAALPNYDPKNPHLVHAQSAEELRRRFYAAVENGTEFVYDGTGSTAERYVNYIQTARDAGYHVTLCYVRCELEVALHRNSQRARTVPTDVVVDKHELIATSFNIVAPFAHEVITVDNN